MKRQAQSMRCKFECRLQPQTISYKPSRWVSCSIRQPSQRYWTSTMDKSKLTKGQARLSCCHPKVQSMLDEDPARRTNPIWLAETGGEVMLDGFVLACLLKVETLPLDFGGRVQRGTLAGWRIRWSLYSKDPCVNAFDDDLWQLQWFDEPDW
jgi:hypothetical protein